MPSRWGTPGDLRSDRSGAKALTLQVPPCPVPAGRGRPGWPGAGDGDGDTDGDGDGDGDARPYRAEGVRPPPGSGAHRVCGHRAAGLGNVGRGIPGTPACRHRPEQVPTSPGRAGSTGTLPGERRCCGPGAALGAALAGPRPLRDGLRRPPALSRANRTTRHRPAAVKTQTYHSVQMISRRKAQETINSLHLPSNRDTKITSLSCRACCFPNLHLCCHTALVKVCVFFFFFKINIFNLNGKYFVLFTGKRLFP